MPPLDEAFVGLHESNDGPVTVLYHTVESAQDRTGRQAGRQTTAPPVMLPRDRPEPPEGHMPAGMQLRHAAMAPPAVLLLPAGSAARPQNLAQAPKT